jgi:hypothetical protein
VRSINTTGTSVSLTVLSARQKPFLWQKQAHVTVFCTVMTQPDVTRPDILQATFWFLLLDSGGHMEVQDEKVFWDYIPLLSFLSPDSKPSHMSSQQKE